MFNQRITDLDLGLKIILKTEKEYSKSVLRAQLKSMHRR